MKRERHPLEKYCLDLSSPVPDYLNDLERQTHLRTLAPQMMSGPLQGRLLSMISKMIRPHCILEVGTFTGYATLCLAEGLADNGSIHTIDVNDELGYISDKFFSDSPFKDQIFRYTGKAEAILPQLHISPDLVFLDAGKQDYPLHFEECMKMMNPGGWILVDNTLWSKKVLIKRKDTDTGIIDSFNKMVLDDSRVDCFILPIRDGISIIRKIK